MGAAFFIRNDDVWTLDGPFRFFFEAAMDHGLPVVHAVIPAKMEAALVRFLRRAKEKTPQWLDIVQHGWAHADHSPKQGMKYEFGPSRPYDAQLEDVRRGLDHMHAAFGAHFTEAFVPPYHGLDQNTLRVLAKQGFRILSAGTVRRPGPKGPFLEVPAQVSFSRYDGQGTGIHPAKDVMRALAKAAARRPLSGLLTHHADFSTAESRRELIKFFGYMAALRDKQKWRPLLFSDIITFKGRVCRTPHCPA